MLEFDLYIIILFALSIVISISIHEFSHAGALYLLGDRSERTMARLSMRPNLHIKWWGLLIMIFTGLIIGNPVFYDEDEFKSRYKQGLTLIIIKLAGPLSNLAAAILILFVIRYLQHYPGIEDKDYIILVYILQMLVYVNLNLFFFNMLPLPMLDGGVFLLLLGIHINWEGLFIIIGYIALIAFIVISYVNPESALVTEFNKLQGRFIRMLTSLILGKGEFVFLNYVYLIS